MKIQHTHLSPRLPCIQYFNKTVPETKFNTVNIFNKFETSYVVDINNLKKSTLNFLWFNKLLKLIINVIIIISRFTIGF